MGRFTSHPPLVILAGAVGSAAGAIRRISRIASPCRLSSVALSRWLSWCSVPWPTSEGPSSERAGLSRYEKITRAFGCRSRRNNKSFVVHFSRFSDRQTDLSFIRADQQACGPSTISDSAAKRNRAGRWPLAARASSICRISPSRPPREKMAIRVVATAEASRVGNNRRPRSGCQERDLSHIVIPERTLSELEIRSTKVPFAPRQ